MHHPVKAYRGRMRQALALLAATQQEVTHLCAHKQSRSCMGSQDDVVHAPSSKGLVIFLGRTTEGLSLALLAETEVTQGADWLTLHGRIRSSTLAGACSAAAPVSGHRLTEQAQQLALLCNGPVP